MSDVVTSKTVTRFAPSPTGRLHLGHAYSALYAEASAREMGGRFLLRIEDIDRTRCRPEFEVAIFEDLAWLGLAWETPVRRQSCHLADYGAALARLQEQGTVYPCFCTRRDIQREINHAGRAPHGRNGLIYPGTCRHLSDEVRRARIDAGDAYALRLDSAAAFALTGPLTFMDRCYGQVNVNPSLLGDVVVARKDIGASYHIAVTVDDALQAVSYVTRGEDLFEVTHVHRLLQRLLGLPEPDYAHHRLLVNVAGERLAKRDNAATIQSLRVSGKSAAEVRAAAGF
tara:strand:- start:526 stop:1380 length:855 start_codon:yes stop_codon:yes gene_type:complete